MTDDQQQRAREIVADLLKSVGHTCHCTHCEERISEAIGRLTMVMRRCPAVVLARIGKEEDEKNE